MSAKKARARSQTEHTMSRRGSSVIRNLRSHAPPKPLRGKSFYLDVPKKNRSNQLEEAIFLLGGNIARFLNKHVTCVVIDRPVVRRTSPRFHPSRGQIMLQNAKPIVSNLSSSDVIRNAKNWKIPVKTFDEFKEWLKVRRATDQASVKATKKRIKVRWLRGAFIKVEDRSRKYRPLVKEMKSWPRPNLDAKPGKGPFDDVKRVRRSSTPSTPRRKMPFRKATIKKGYCELCGVEYEGVTKRHLDGNKHKSEANMPDKYSGVDKLINSGISLKQFLDRVKSRQKLKPARETPTTEPVTERTITLQTVTIRRSMRLIAASLEGSAYFKLPTNVTYTLAHKN